MSAYQELLPILIFIIVAVFTAVAIAVFGKILSIIIGVNQPNRKKNLPFECGFPEFSNARMKFDVRFYLVAILFLIFDLEVIFMMPWGILLRKSPDIPKISWESFFAMIIFLFILLVGFIYEWKKGALEWE